jgi:hypothetical protein
MCACEAQEALQALRGVGTYAGEASPLHWNLGFSKKFVGQSKVKIPKNKVFFLQI